jgi:hypothetical protein
MPHLSPRAFPQLLYQVQKARVMMRQAQGLGAGEAWRGCRISTSEAVERAWEMFQRASEMFQIFEVASHH